MPSVFTIINDQFTISIRVYRFFPSSSWVEKGIDSNRAGYTIIATSHHPPMRSSSMRRNLLVLLSLVCAVPLLAQEIEPEDLKPGLLATYQERTARAMKMTRLEHTIALNLGEDESPHPAVEAGRGTYTWEGYIKVLRNGEYTLAARLRGNVRISIGGKVFETSALGERAELKSSPSVTLKAGIQPIRVVYDRPEKGRATLELLWKVPQFRFEQIPSEQLGHLPNNEAGEFKQSSRIDHGRFVFEEHGCVNCHNPEEKSRLSTSLVSRQGPNLTQIGSRVYSGWLESWMLDPSKHRPNTTMPKLFSDDANGKAEAKAVAHYLVTLGGPMPDNKQKISPQDLAKGLSKGQSLFTSVGCAACHQEKPAVKEFEPSVYGLLSPLGVQSHYALGALGSKTRADRLATFLLNPLATHPNGRMPNLSLTNEEARDLSLYLVTSRDEKIPQEIGNPTEGPPAALMEAVLGKNNLGKIPVTAQWAEVGQKLVTTKGCVNCHIISPNNQPLPKLATKSLHTIRQKPDQGCLSGKGTSVAVYKLSETDRDSLTAWLKASNDAEGVKAPTYEARVAFKRFNCLNCHQREGEGGLSVELIEQMQKLEKSENIDDVRPPTLNGVGHKLLTPWFQKVLTQGGRARPWMSLRMPQYGEQNVGKLAEGITHLEGADLEEKITDVELTPTKVQVGKLMIGKTGLGCISCHDIAGIPNTGTRGPDLASTNQRVRYSWYRDWLEQPQRMAPNTRMPQIFVDNKSLFPNALDGNPDAQAEAMWAYMSLGSKMPLPIGLEPPKGLVVKVDGETEILRTFMPEAGNRAIAVGFPGGVNVAFDANQCRLSYGWAGNFLDASPVWNNRGGAPAKLLGPKFWTAPPGNPWSVGGSQEPPDFAKRSNDPAFGKPLPDLQLFKGDRKVFFDGYSLDEKSVPTFYYRVLGEGTAPLTVVEKVEPLKSIATGFLRDFKLTIPPNSASYLNAGESNQEPKLFNADGSEVKLDLKSGASEQEVAGKLVILPGEGDGSTVLSLSPSIEGVKWRLQPRPGGGWQALVKIPMTKTGVKGDLPLKVWSLGKVDPAFLKGLNAK
jgi:cytochrome c551/c552